MLTVLLPSPSHHLIFFSKYPCFLFSLLLSYFITLFFLGLFYSMVCLFVCLSVFGLVLFLCVLVVLLHVCLGEGVGSLELELEAVESCRVGAGNLDWPSRRTANTLNH